MERIYFLFIILIIAHGLQAQNVGINTASPVMPLHVASSNGNSTILENTNPLAVGVESNLYFSTGLSGQNPIKYTGAIKAIGTGTDYARLGLFTYASSGPAGLLERLSITDNGNVGIGTTVPGYKLDVNGTLRTQSHLQVDGNSTLSGNVYLNGTLNPNTPLSIGSNVIVGGTLNPNTPLSIGNNANVGGTLTISNGKGIVRSANATQMKIKRGSIGLGASMGAGSTLTSGLFGFGEAFSSVIVTVGQSYNGTGDWAKVLIVPFNVDLVANTCQFKITNTSTSGIDFSGNWEVVLIGN